MIHWVKRLARIVAIGAFFVVFLSGIDPLDPFNIPLVSAALLRGVGAMALFWFAGFIAGDIVLKGVVEDVPDGSIDDLEGGIPQRVKETKANTGAAALAATRGQPVQAGASRSGKG